MVNKKYNIVSIVGTRPEIIKLSEVLKKLDTYYNHILVHTGQNYDYELNEIFFNDLGIRKPDHFLNCASETPAKTIANVIEKSDLLFRNLNPDAILIYGDTNSCLSVISAKRLKIPIFHLEAGNRCFDLRVPEEINRKIVDHLSDINMVHSEHARKYLISEGIKPETIFLVGSPMYEIFNAHKDKLHKLEILQQFNLVQNGYFVASIHREENVDNPKNLEKIVQSLNFLAKKSGKKIILSLHPRTKNRIESNNMLKFCEDIIISKPFGFFDYINLQLFSACVISDSGTITEESSILNFPAVMLRETHERPEGMDVGAVIMSGLEESLLSNSIKIAQDLRNERAPIANYDNQYFSSQIVKIIYSYISYINTNHWKKNESLQG